MQNDYFCIIICNKGEVPTASPCVKNLSEMKKLILTIIMAAAAQTPAAMASHLSFPSDALGRGYHDRPWLRYEAEPDLCSDWQGEMLLPPVPFSQIPLQAEASRRCALTLASDGDFVEWKCSREADGLSLRFSLPDSHDGTGLKGSLALYAGGEKLADIALDSYWAWQYTSVANTSEKYPDNTPSDSKFARMRFDEVYVRLPRPIAGGETFRLVKEDGSDTPYTVDFVELEKIPAPVAFEDIEGEKVLFDGSEALATVINRSAGKTVYIPEGTYNVPRRVSITVPGVKVVGAGMWYTTLFFNASSDSRSTYSQRGFESYCDGIVLQGFSMNTVNNKRYFENNPAYQVGKALQGSFGSGSVIRDVRADHFECGGWIADYAGAASRGLTVEHCRFRNNYADGFNLCSGTTGARVSHCSFRNNGDDDMAVWSTGNVAADNVYEYNTAENNWRASSCAIYGGRSNSARNLYIADPMEEGLHVNGEFQGTGFEGVTSVSQVTVERAGIKGGTPGQHGGFWGSACPAIHVRGGYHIAVRDVEFSDIDIIDSGYRAFGISSNSGKSVTGLKIRNLHVDGVSDNGWALYVDPSAVGSGSYEKVSTVNCTEPAIGNGSTRFTLTGDDSGTGSLTDDCQALSLTVCGRTVSLDNAAPGTVLTAFYPDGQVAASAVASGQSVSLTLPGNGLYIVSDGSRTAKVAAF